jgi:flagellar capping protein FliD
VLGFQDRIESLNAIIDGKKTRLEKQFADMESTLAKLQSQQSAITSYTPPTYSK